MTGSNVALGNALEKFLGFLPKSLDRFLELHFAVPFLKLGFVIGTAGLPESPTPQSKKESPQQQHIQRPGGMAGIEGIQANEEAVDDTKTDRAVFEALTAI